MGQDKGKMLVKDKPMILHIMDTLEGHVQEIIFVLRDENQINIYKKIIQNHKSRDFSFDLKIVKDDIKDQGPLIGIFTGLKQIKTDYALVLPCDSPLITDLFIENIFTIMKNSKGEFDALVPKWNSENIEPLHSVYNKQILNRLESLISDGKRDVKSLINQLNVYFIEVDKLDPSTRSFKNFNTIEDIKKL